MHFRGQIFRSVLGSRGYKDTYENRGEDVEDRMHGFVTRLAGSGSDAAVATATLDIVVRFVIPYGRLSINSVVG